MTKTKSSAFALCLTLAASLLPTGCATPSSAPAAGSQIYQPRALFLKAGQPVPTREGLYTPQTDETWHSAAAYSALETQLVNAAAAAAQNSAK